MNTLNTTFQILKANEEGEMIPLFTEIRRDKKVPFSLRCWFISQLGQDVKFIMWTEGDLKEVVLGRGGVMKNGF